MISSISAEVWWTVAIIVGIIGLCILGYFYKPKEDGPLIIMEVVIVGICAAFWPIILLIAVVIGISMLLVLLGMYIKKLKCIQEQIRREKLENMNNAEKILKK